MTKDFKSLLKQELPEKISQVFEDYRLLKTLEQKIGKEETLHLLHQEGVHGVHAYPKSVIWHENFRKKIMLSCVLDE